MNNALWTKRDTITAIVYTFSLIVAGWIVWRLGGDPFSWLFAIPFLFGYFTGRINKTIDKL